MPALKSAKMSAIRGLIFTVGMCIVSPDPGITFARVLLFVRFRIDSIAIGSGCHNGVLKNS
jgi:hypothetical protein